MDHTLAPKVIDTFVLIEDITMKTGQVLPRGAVGVHCYRTSTEDMFTRVHFKVGGEALTLSGLVLCGDASFAQDEWDCFPTSALRYFDPEKESSMEPWFLSEGVEMMMDMLKKTVPCRVR